MSVPLYNREILRLAASLVPDDRLENPDGVAEARSPLCGSRIYAEISVAPSGALSALAIRASACALGQTSAAILRANGLGQTAAAITGIRAGIASALAGEGEMPAIWPDLQLLALARDHKARHAAIFLPFDAVLAAFANADTAKP